MSTSHSNVNLLIVGNIGGTNIAESFNKSALKFGWNVTILNARAAQTGLRFIDSFCWRFLDKKPFYYSWFNRRLRSLGSVKDLNYFISTGFTPVSSKSLRALRARGIRMIHFSSDDPWNPGQHTNWFLDSLVLYDHIYSPRKSNIREFYQLGCTNVHYLPFGYDEFIFTKSPFPITESFDVLFVGGADNDRFFFIKELIDAGVKIKVVGDYWARYILPVNCNLGHLNPSDVIKLTICAKINICLVRKANRDGHVMRSFEIAALGSCMLVEKTLEHLDIFGPEGVSVLYFESIRDAKMKIDLLLKDKLLRMKLRSNVFERIQKGGNSYSCRLKTMLNPYLCLPTDE